MEGLVKASATAMFSANYGGEGMLEAPVITSGSSLQKPYALCPSLPIDLFGTVNFKNNVHRKIVGEKDQIFAVLPGRRNNETIAPNKRRRSADLLRTPIIWVLVAIDSYSETVKCRSDKAKGSVTANAQLMNDGGFRRARIKLRQIIGYFCQGTFPVKARI
jgi:hypothetical protein